MRKWCKACSVRPKPKIKGQISYEICPLILAQWEGFEARGGERRGEKRPADARRKQNKKGKHLWVLPFSCFLSAQLLKSRELEAAAEHSHGLF